MYLQSSSTSTSAEGPSTTAIRRAQSRKTWSCRDTAGRQAPKNVVETAREAGSFDILLGALRAAGLESALEGTGPFTVFAPSDEAFAKVPVDKLQGLLSKPEELAKVLKYHVVAGRLTSTDLASVASVRTLDGRTLSLNLARDGRVGDALVVKADVACGNGVIHVIDSVLVPE